MSQRKIKVAVLGLALASIGVAGFAGPAFLAAPVQAKPAFMDRFNRDEYSKSGLRGRCTVCHIGRGGGERNDFGEAFEDAGYRITPRLRAKYPTLFEENKTASAKSAQPGSTTN